MVRCASKNGHQIDTCFKEIGLLSQALIIIDWIVNSQHKFGLGGGELWLLGQHFWKLSALEQGFSIHILGSTKIKIYYYIVNMESNILRPIFLN